LKGFAAESRIALAAIALEEARPADAEGLARAAAEQFAQEQQADNEGWARAILAEALAAQSRDPEADAELARARERAAAGQNLSIRLFVQRKSAALQMRQLNKEKTALASIQHDLATALSAAKSAGLTVEAMEIQLLQYQSLKNSDLTTENMADIGRVAQNATQRGLGQISKKAQALVREKLLSN
jgi:hypothetical protein